MLTTNKLTKIVSGLATISIAAVAGSLLVSPSVSALTFENGDFEGFINNGNTVILDGIVYDAVQVGDKLFDVFNFDPAFIGAGFSIEITNSGAWEVTLDAEPIGDLGEGTYIVILNHFQKSDKIILNV